MISPISSVTGGEQYMFALQATKQAKIYQFRARSEVDKGNWLKFIEHVKGGCKGDLPKGDTDPVFDFMVFGSKSGVTDEAVEAQLRERAFSATTAQNLGVNLTPASPYMSKAGRQNSFIMKGNDPMTTGKILEEPDTPSPAVAAPAGLRESTSHSGGSVGGSFSAGDGRNPPPGVDGSSARWKTWISFLDALQKKKGRDYQTIKLVDDEMLKTMIKALGFKDVFQQGDILGMFQTFRQQSHDEAARQGCSHPIQCVTEWCGLDPERNRKGLRPIKVITHEEMKIQQIAT
eukprot:g21304.t1